MAQGWKRAVTSIGYVGVPAELMPAIAKGAKMTVVSVINRNRKK